MFNNNHSHNTASAGGFVRSAASAGLFGGIDGGIYHYRGLKKSREALLEKKSDIPGYLIDFFLGYRVDKTSIIARTYGGYYTSKTYSDYGAIEPDNDHYLDISSLSGSYEALKIKRGNISLVMGYQYINLNSTSYSNRKFRFWDHGFVYGIETCLNLKVPNQEFDLEKFLDRISCGLKYRYQNDKEPFHRFVLKIYTYAGDRWFVGISFHYIYQKDIYEVLGIAISLHG